MYFSFDVVRLSLNFGLQWTYCSPPDDTWVWSPGVMILTWENRRTHTKPWPSATLSTINPTWIDPGENPGLRGERLATDRLNHGTATGVVTRRSKHQREKCTCMLPTSPFIPRPLGKNTLSLFNKINHGTRFWPHPRYPSSRILSTAPQKHITLLWLGSTQGIDIQYVATSTESRHLWHQYKK
jgi:hypothetical protein